MIPTSQHPDDLLSALLDDELDDETARGVEGHVADCTLCGDELAATELVRHRLRGLPPVTAPPGLVDQCIAQRRRANRWGVAVAGAAAAVALVTGFVFADPPAEANRPADQQRLHRDGQMTIRRQVEAEQTDSSITDRIEEVARDLVSFLGG